MKNNQEETYIALSLKPCGIEMIPEGLLENTLKRAIELLSKERILVEVKAKRVLIVGDLHGTLEGLEIGKKYLNNNKCDLLIFLGDYVDRGPLQLETLYEVLRLKIENPKKVYILRGNHEDLTMNYFYGFYRDLLMYSQKIRELIRDLYTNLPLALVLNDTYGFVHGGISSGVDSIWTLKNVPKEYEYPDIYKEILWNDPSTEVEYFSFNYMRGGFKVFGKRALEEFLENSDLKCLIRSHEYYPNGFVELWGGLLYTVHSSTAYGPVSVAFLDTEIEKIKKIDI